MTCIKPRLCGLVCVVGSKKLLYSCIPSLILILGVTEDYQDDGMSLTHSLSSPVTQKNLSTTATPMTIAPTTPGAASTPSRTETPSSTPAFIPTSSLPQLGAVTAPQPTFLPDFGLSALSSLTQIAKLQPTTAQKDFSISNLQGAFQQHVPSTDTTLGSSQLAAHLAQSNNLAQTLAPQNLASLGSLSLEAFKQVSVSMTLLRN